MDLARPALLKQIELHLSAEGRGFIYLLHDRASGQILRVSRQVAEVWGRLCAAAGGDPAERAALQPDEARKGLAALSIYAGLRQNLWFGRRKFNPVQMQFTLLDAGPLQPRFRGVARHVFGVPGAVLMGVLALWVLFLGTRNDWSILAEFHSIFSLQALLTFGLVAPVLKLIHECGHFLAATRFDVRLRRAGINVIGLYPLPFVDCTEADLVATRRQRIVISGAGILTDFTIGMVLFIAWHLMPEGAGRIVVGHAFVYSTFSSLLFNANPLMRMDGYFILSDLLGRRNFGTDAAAALRRTRRRLMGDPQPIPGHWREEAALTLFGAASLVYRWIILFTLVWHMLPRYLGFGLFAGVWGGMLLVAQPFGAVATGFSKTEGPVWSRRRLLPIFALAAVTGVFFIPVAPVTVVELSLDTAGTYAVTVARPGFIADTPASPM